MQPHASQPLSDPNQVAALRAALHAHVRAPEDLALQQALVLALQPLIRRCQARALKHGLPEADLADFSQQLLLRLVRDGYLAGKTELCRKAAEGAPDFANHLQAVVFTRADGFLSNLRRTAKRQPVLVSLDTLAAADFPAEPEPDELGIDMASVLERFRASGASERDVQIFAGLYMEGLEQKQVAKRLGISPARVWQINQRITRHLRPLLIEERREQDLGEK